MLPIGEHAFTDVCDFPLRGKVIEKLGISHGGVHDIPLDDVFDGSHGVHPEENRGHVEGMVIEEDSFTGFVLLRQWPFFGGEALRRV